MLSTEPWTLAAKSDVTDPWHVFEKYCRKLPKLMEYMRSDKVLDVVRGLGVFSLLIHRVAIRRMTLAAAMLSLAVPAVAAINTGTDAEAQLPYWEVVEHGVSIRLVQRLPDQTRGYFEARGFSTADAELIAQSCVFQTVFKNVAPPSDLGAIEYNLKEWVVHATGAQRQLKTREDWQKEWTARHVSKAAQLAFEWGLLPTRQTYRPGDYNWGMTVFNLAPGTSFDLDVVWHQGGERRSAYLKDVACASDVHVSPAAQ